MTKEEKVREEKVRELVLDKLNYVHDWAADLGRRDNRATDTWAAVASRLREIYNREKSPPSPPVVVTLTDGWCDAHASFAWCACGMKTKEEPVTIFEALCVLEKASPADLHAEIAGLDRELDLIKKQEALLVLRRDLLTRASHADEASPASPIRSSPTTAPSVQVSSVMMSACSTEAFNYVWRLLEQGWSTGHKINLIKAVRDEYTLSLLDSKELVEEVLRRWKQGDAAGV